MAITNIGSQALTHPYRSVLTGENFNREFRDWVRPGVYKGMALTDSPGNIVNISAGTALIQCEYATNDNRMIKVHFQSGFSETVNQTTGGQNEVLYLEHEYIEVIENWVDIKHDSKANYDSLPNLANTIALGEITYDGGGNITGFDLTNRTYGLIDFDQLHSLKDSQIFSNVTDGTKHFHFGGANISTGQDREILIPDEDIVIGGTPDWVTSTFYLVDSVRVHESVLYRCLVEHVSGVFDTDFNAAYWEIVGEPNLPAPIVKVTVANSFIVGQRLRHVSGNTWVTAQADSASTLGTGIVYFASGSEFFILLEGELTLTTGEWDAVLQTGESGAGLTPGDWYYLSATEAGKITATPPTIMDIALKALSATTAMIVNRNYLEDSIASTNVNTALTAAQGKVLDDKITANTTLINAALPSGYKTGLELTYTTSGTITIEPGAARDDTNVYAMNLSSPMIKDVIESGVASWVAGSGNSGIDDVTPGYTSGSGDSCHIFLIGDSTDVEPVDILMSNSISAPTLPAGYDIKRWIGAIIFSAANTIPDFHYREGWIIYDVPLLDFSEAASTVYASRVLNLPDGKSFQYSASLSVTAGAGSSFHISNPDLTDNDNRVWATSFTGGDAHRKLYTWWTDSSQNMRYKGGAAVTITHYMLAYYLGDV